MKQLSTPTFNADTMAGALETLHRALPDGAVTKPNESRPAGAHTFASAGHIRLVLQYDIQTDTYVGRFDVLIEEPAEEGLRWCEFCHAPRAVPQCSVCGTTTRLMRLEDEHSLRVANGITS